MPPASEGGVMTCQRDEGWWVERRVREGHTAEAATRSVLRPRRRCPLRFGWPLGCRVGGTTISYKDWGKGPVVTLCTNGRW